MEKMLTRLAALSKKQGRIQDENEEIMYILNILEKKKQAQYPNTSQDKHLHDLLTQQKDKEYTKQIQENTTKVYKYEQLVTFITTQETSKLQYLLTKLILQPQNASQYYKQLKQMIEDNLVMPNNLPNTLQQTNTSSLVPVKDNEDVLQYVEQIQQLNAQIKQQGQQIMRLIDQNKQLQQQLNNSQQQNITLSKDVLLKMKNDYKQIQVSLQNLKKQVQKNSLQVDDKQIYNLFQKYIFISDQHAQAQSIQHNDQLIQKQLEIDKLIQENNAVQNNIKQLESKQEQMQQENNQIQQLKQALENDNKQLNVQINQLQLVNEKMQQQIDELSSKNNKNEQQKKEQQQSQQQDKTALLQNEKQLNLLQSQIDQLQSQLKLKEEDLQKLQLENKQLYTSKIDIQNTAKQTKDELNTEISQLKEQLQQKQNNTPTIVNLDQQLDKKYIKAQLEQFIGDLQACKEHLLSAKKQQQLKLLNITRSVDQKHREIFEIFESIIKKIPQNDLELQQYKKDLHESHIQLQEKNQDIQNLTYKIEELRQQLLEQPKQIPSVNERDLFNFDFYTREQRSIFNDVFLSVNQLENTRLTAIKNLKLNNLLQKDAGSQVLRVFGLVDQLFANNTIAIDFGFVKNEKFSSANQKVKKSVQINFVRANFNAGMRCYVDTLIEKISERSVNVFPLLTEANIGLHVSLIGIIVYLIIDGWCIATGARVHQGKTMVFPLLQKVDQKNETLTMNALQSLDTELVD